MVAVRRIVYDVLKPHEPELVAFTEEITDLEGVAAANVSVIEIDREVQNVKLTVEGEALDERRVQETIKELGGTVHSIDEVACGEYLVNEPSTSSLVRPSWLR